MKAAMRDLWSGHNFWIRNVALDNTTNNRKALVFAEKAVMANAKQIARMFTPFYGEAVTEQFFSILVKHYDAIKAYSEATVGGSKSQQDAALADYASNTDEIAAFFSGVNRYLPKDTVRNLFAAHGAHHVELINELQEKDYAHEAETWQAMQQHVYAIADTLVTALEKQFPHKFPSFHVH
jgi:hemoglobin-like flavoprotein